MSLLTPDPTSYVPTNSLVTALLTDQYQLTMAYSFWQNSKHTDPAIYEVVFRKAPFEGEFCLFAGLDDVLRFLNTFKFSEHDIMLLRSHYPTWDSAFFDYLATIDAKEITVHAVREGSVVFPRLPLLIVEGPLMVCQLLETTLLVLINYASLVTTNAARHRLAVGSEKKLFEFGLRRAQGPDGGMSASKYAYIGGFDGTSNVLAAMRWGMPLVGTHAHSFVTAFTDMAELPRTTITAPSGEQVEFVALVLKYSSLLKRDHTHRGELASFVAFAQSFPTAFVALIDTFDTLESGLWNYLAVALALYRVGYRPMGVRIDSGDLAYLSRRIRVAFVDVSEKFQVPLGDMSIVASNDLTEAVLSSLQQQPHSIDTFAVGTHLVTCRDQPALGCVYKCVSVGGQPRMKLSEDRVKITLPGAKRGYRLTNASGECVLDLLCQAHEPSPQPGQKVLCRHPFDANRRVLVTAAAVTPMHHLVWQGKVVASTYLEEVRRLSPRDPAQPAPAAAAEGVVLDGGHTIYEPISVVRDRVQHQLSTFREDHLRKMNPTPYKLSLSAPLYDYLHDLWLKESPIREIE